MSRTTSNSGSTLHFTMWGSHAFTPQQYLSIQYRLALQLFIAPCFIRSFCRLCICKLSIPSKLHWPHKSCAMQFVCTTKWSYFTLALTPYVNDWRFPLLLASSCHFLFAERSAFPSLRRGNFLRIGMSCPCWRQYQKHDVLASWIPKYRKVQTNWRWQRGWQHVELCELETLRVVKGLRNFLQLL